MINIRLSDYSRLLLFPFSFIIFVTNSGKITQIDLPTVILILDLI